MPPPEDIQFIKSKSPTPGPSSKTSQKRRHSKFEPSGGGLDRPSKRAREDNVRSVQTSSPPVPERSRDIGGRKRPQQTISSSTPSSSKKNLRRIVSPEVIPDSDEEMDGPASLTTNINNPSVIKEPNQALGSTSIGTSLQTFEHEVVDFHPLFDEEPEKPKVPTLRTRLTEPRVKMVDDPNLSNIEGTISAKAYAVARMNTEPSSSKPTVLSSPQSDRRRSKPGPGRSSAGLVKNVSSLLTFSNGSLKTVRGKYIKEGSRTHISDLTVRGDPPDTVEVDNAISENPSPAPPTAEELLRLAGLNTAIADTLPDYEDNPVEMNVIEPTLLDATESAVPTANTENGNESSSLHKERSADCTSSNTNLTNFQCRTC